MNLLQSKLETVRAWLAETFHGLTWPRFGVFCLGQTGPGSQVLQGMGEKVAR